MLSFLKDVSKEYGTEIMGRGENPRNTQKTVVNSGLAKAGWQESGLCVPGGGG